MRARFTTAMFLLAGFVNGWPLVGVLGAERLTALYGVPIADDAVLLLLRHRAALFGLLGALLIAAAFRPALRKVAAAAGLLSMLSFMALAIPPSAYGATITRIFWIDAIASALLLAAIWSMRADRSHG